MKRTKTTTFLLELPLRVDAGQASRLRAHLEVARCFYNSMLGEAQKRLGKVRSDPAWQQARNIPCSQKQERSRAFSAVRQQHGFSEYALHASAKDVRKSWIADHLDAHTAQTLATRAFQAVNKVCLGQAKKVRFKSKGRGLDSVEGKTNTTGIRFVLQDPTHRNTGALVWGKERLPALINYHDPVICHSLKQRIKFARLVRRKASSPRAKGADGDGNRYFVQLALEGLPFQKPKNSVGTDTIGLDIGPSSLAIVPQQGQAQLKRFCEELQPDARKKRRLARTMDRQRRANNPQNFDPLGRVKKGRLTWKTSKRYLAIRQQHATMERKLAAYRKSLHGRLVNDLIRVGSTIRIEKTSFKGWQKMFGRSVALRAPGMFYTHLKRIVAKTGGTLHEVGTHTTRLSQYCHGCQTYAKKPLSQRWHTCQCGIGSVQRDLYSAFLLAYLNPTETIPSIAQSDWEGAEPRLRAAIECVHQRANEGHILPGSFGIPRAGVRQLKSLVSPQQELSPHLLQYRKGRVETLDAKQEPSRL